MSEDTDEKRRERPKGEVIEESDVLVRLKALHEKARHSFEALDTEWLGVRRSIHDKRGERTDLQERIRQLTRTIEAWEARHPQGEEPAKVIPLRGKLRNVTQIFEIEKERELLLSYRRRHEQAEKELGALEQIEEMLTKGKEAEYRRMRRIEEIQKNYLFSKRERDRNDEREKP